jgi:hypothetical protein
VASYSFTTQFIELSEVDSATFRGAHAGNVALLRKVMVPLVHEVRHWLDHTCSLWGQTQLCMGYDAQHARLANNPSELWRIAAYRQRLRDDRFADYYAVIENASPSDGKKHLDLPANRRFAVRSGWKVGRGSSNSFYAFQLAGRNSSLSSADFSRCTPRNRGCRFRVQNRRRLYRYSAGV